MDPHSRASKKNTSHGNEVLPQDTTHPIQRPLVLLQGIFPKRSWMVVGFPNFTGVKPFTSWYALLQLFFLRFSSISLHCSAIQFSFAFFKHLLMLLFTSQYFSDPSSLNLFFLSSLFLLHKSRISAVTQRIFFWWCL